MLHFTEPVDAAVEALSSDPDCPWMRMIDWSLLPGMQWHGGHQESGARDRDSQGDAWFWLGDRRQVSRTSAQTGADQPIVGQSAQAILASSPRAKRKHWGTGSQFQEKRETCILRCSKRRQWEPHNCAAQAEERDRCGGEGLCLTSGTLKKYIGCAALLRKLPRQFSGDTRVAIPVQTIAHTCLQAGPAGLAAAHCPLLSPAQHLQQGQGWGAYAWWGAHHLWARQCHVPHEQCEELEECHSGDGEGMLWCLLQIPEVSQYGFVQPACCVMEDEGTWENALVKTEKQDKTQANSERASPKMQVNPGQALGEFRTMDSIQGCWGLKPLPWGPLMSVPVLQGSVFAEWNTEVRLCSWLNLGRWGILHGHTCV